MTVVQSQFAPHVAMLVAQECGFVSGIDLEIRQTPSSNAQLSGLLDGSLDIVISAIDNVFVWVESGARVTLAGQAESITPLELFAEPGVTSLEQLSNRTFAVDAFDNGFSLIARSVFQQLGIEPIFVETGGVVERLRALADGEVAATLLGPPLSQAASQQGFRSLVALEDMMPEYPGQGVIVRNESLDRDDVQAVLHGLERAIDYTNSIPEAEGLDILRAAGLTSSADQIWRTRPRTFEVSLSGLSVVQRLRESLGLLPPGFNILDLVENNERKAKFT